MMYRVTDNLGNVHALVDTRDEAEKVVAMRRTGRDGEPIRSPANATKASLLTYRIEEVPDSTHPGWERAR